MVSPNPSIPLTTISGGISRLRTKAAADKNVLYDLLNGYVTQANTVKVRPGTFRNANIAAYAGVGTTKGLVAYQGQKHVFSDAVVPVPPGYALHVLGHPIAQQTGYSGTLAPVSTIVTNSASEGSFPFAGTWESAGYGYSNGTYTDILASVGAASVTSIDGSALVVAGVVTGYGYGTPASPAVIIALAGDLPQGLLQSVTITPTGGAAQTLTGANATFNPGGNVPATTGYTVWAWPVSSATNYFVAGSASTVVFSVYGGSGDADWLDVGLLLPFDGNFTDASLYNTTVTNAGATFNTATPMFGSASVNFAGSQYIQYPSSAGGALDLSSADFTIEFWMRTTTTQLQSIILDGTNALTTGFRLYYVYNSPTAQSLTVQCGAYGWATATSANVPVGKNASDGFWHHYAVTRSGNSMYIFMDGATVGASTLLNLYSWTGSFGTSSPTTSVGGGYLSGLQSTWLHADVDELRVTKGVARYTANFTPPAAAFPTTYQPGTPLYVPIPIKEIHFAAPFLGGLYVVAEFDTSSAVAAQYGSVFHYWIQSSTVSDNSNEWTANTDFKIGDVAIPTTPNGLTYIATRRYPPNPLWTANTIEAVNNVVEPTVANGFKYTVTSVAGANPSTSSSEPVWPTSDGATVLEDSSVANDQTITVATAAPAVPATAVPTRYANTIAGGFKT